MLKRSLILVSLSFCAFAQMKETAFFPTSYQASDLEAMKILDVKELDFGPLNEIPFTEVSDLAFDDKKGLFAVSDRGYLYRLELKIKDKKFNSLRLQNAYALKTKKGKRLEKGRRDAEGLVMTPEGLSISFEGTPKISLFDYKGRKIKNYPLPPVLQDIKNYQKPNSALEALAFHPQYGLITAPEQPLKHTDETLHTLFSLHKRWMFKASAAITAVETMDDGNLLVLERDFDYLRQSHTITLTKVSIMGCNTQICPARILARLQSEKGWKLDNFEGLSRIGKSQYLMVSDDNGSFFQKCIIVLFEVK